MMRGDTECSYNAQFQQVFIKSEFESSQGSSSSLSVDSTKLRKDSPPLFLIGNNVEESTTEESFNYVAHVSQGTPKTEFAEIKSEPSDQYSEHVAKVEFDAEEDQDDIEFQKRKIIENETTVYRCQDCDGVFQKFHEYKFHRAQHSIERRTCKICYVICQGVTKLNEHMYVHTGEKPFKCEKCQKGFISAHTLKCHMECHRSDFNFKCETCGKTFKTKRSLRGHMDTHAKKVKDFTCMFCEEEFQVASEYRRHIFQHGAQPPEPKCNICHKVFKYHTQLRTHLSTHTELRFPCQYCNKIFATMTKIRKHINRSHVVNECEFCKKVYYDKAEFTKHKKTEHVEEKPTICEFCNKAYDKPKNLQEHIRVQHTKDGLENKCETCEKTFINRFLLNNHIKTHYKCFKCSSCNMTFASRYNLQLHSVTHTNERKYKCMICTKSYSSKVSLQNHTTSHFDERPFGCTQCGKYFKNNRRLYVHKMSHETQLKFECFTCGRKFKTKQYLKSHLYKHDKVQPFNCPNCSKRFKHKKTLDKHMLKQHRIQIGAVKASDSRNVKNTTFPDVESEDEEMESTDDSTSENAVQKSLIDKGSDVTNTAEYHLDYRDDIFDSSAEFSKSDGLDLPNLVNVKVELLED